MSNCIDDVTIIIYVSPPIALYGFLHVRRRWFCAAGFDSRVREGRWKWW
jgi:hypothetical protein